MAKLMRVPVLNVLNMANWFLLAVFSSELYHPVSSEGSALGLTSLVHTRGHLTAQIRAIYLGAMHRTQMTCRPPHEHMGSEATQY